MKIEIAAMAALPPSMDCSTVFAWWRQCGPPSDIQFPDPTQICIPNQLTIGSAVSAQLTPVPSTLTTESTTCGVIGQIYAVCVLQSKNIYNAFFIKDTNHFTGIRN